MAVSRKNNRRATPALDQFICGCVWERTGHGDTIVLPCIQHAYSEKRDGRRSARLRQKGKIR